MTPSGIVLIGASLVILAVTVAALVDLLRNVPMPVWVSCPDCDGLGIVDRDTSDPRTCGTCQGWGRVEDTDQAEDTARLIPMRLRRIRLARRSRAASRTQRGIQ
ncbi:hypothetical protein [Nocardia sp. IFM 10818]